jgi:hypothetical protein
MAPALAPALALGSRPGAWLPCSSPVGARIPPFGHDTTSITATAIGWQAGSASPPRAVRLSHRLTGFGLFALTVPIAVHCVLAYGVQLTSARVAVHSLAGCLFYGAFTAKVLLVRTRQLPGWALPAAGGALALLVAVL